MCIQYYSMGIAWSLSSLLMVHFAFGDVGAEVTFRSHQPIFVKLTSQDKLQRYRQDIQEQVQKSQDLLQDLQRRIEARSQENQETLKRKMMKLNKEIEHAQRIYDNFDTIETKDWLRSKSEVDAVMARLDAAYDEILPALNDISRYLQEAVHHANIAVEYGKEERKNLFLKNSEKARDYATRAKQEGLDSELLSEGISELRDAIAHIKLDKMGAATTLLRGASLHLQSAFTQVMNTQ